MSLTRVRKGPKEEEHARLGQVPGCQTGGRARMRALRGKQRGGNCREGADYVCQCFGVRWSLEVGRSPQCKLCSLNIYAELILVLVGKYSSLVRVRVVHRVSPYKKFFI